MGYVIRVTVIVAAALLSGASCVTRTEPPVTCLSIVNGPINKGYQGIAYQVSPDGVWMGAYRSKDGAALVIIAPKAVVPEAARKEADGECLDPKGQLALHKTQYVSNQQTLEQPPQVNGAD